MKRSNNLYSACYDLNNIVSMTNKVCTTVRNKSKVDKFELYKTEHIINIKNRLMNNNLSFGKYNIFMITDPKCRIVMAQEIEDKIINHLIAEHILVKTFEPKYPNSMIATRKGKGTSYGIKLLKKYLNEIKNKYDNFYVLKIDISKYFYNIDHNILKRILLDNIKDKDALKVLFSIIDSTNHNYINNKINSLINNRINYLNDSNLKNKESLIKETSEVPIYKYNKGAPLGDQTSQCFGLIYLLEINHYIKEDLHIRFLLNFMDGFILLHHSKEYLKYCLNCITNKLRKDYELEINKKKTRIDSIKNGIDFLGYRFYIKNNHIIMKLRNNTKKKFKKKTKNINLLYNNKYIDYFDYKRLLSSYKGILMYGNCNNLYYQTVGGFIC